MLGVGSWSRRKYQLYTTSEATLDEVNITGTWGLSARPRVWPVSQMTANVEMSLPTTSPLWVQSWILFKDDVK